MTKHKRKPVVKGRSADIVYGRSLDEYRVKLYLDGVYLGTEGDYYTNDLSEAQSIVQTFIGGYMAKTRKISEHIKGRMAIVRYNPETEEYIVRFYVDGVYQENADYFTDDKGDAQGTADVFIKSGE